jgi:dihydrofolate synthase / folylpolyglutamate synthase
VGMVGILSDKDISATAAAFSETFNKFLVTAPQSPRALPPERLSEALGEAGVEEIEVFSDSAAGFARLSELALERDAIGVVCGSLYLVGEVLATLREDVVDE